MIDNESTMQILPFVDLDLQPKLLPNQEAFLNEHADQGTVYQTAVNYVNPQWMDIGRDLTAMVTGAMQPEDVLESIDKRRTDFATAADDPAWGN
jgi:raffinose/stachyose/melibiose transport system substrate-binding protein